MRKNFAKQVKDNYKVILSKSEFEEDVLRALVDQGLLEDRISQTDYYFDACDIDCGPDGRISFDEIIKAVDGTGVFAKSRDDPAFKDSEEEVVTLQDLEAALEKIDFFADKHLDRLEFLLIALDHSLIFQKETLIKLFRVWAAESINGTIHKQYHLMGMLDNANTTNSADHRKEFKLKHMLTDLGILAAD